MTTKPHHVYKYGDTAHFEGRPVIFTGYKESGGYQEGFGFLQAIIRDGDKVKIVFTDRLDKR